MSWSESWPWPRQPKGSPVYVEAFREAIREAERTRAARKAAPVVTPPKAPAPAVVERKPVDCSEGVTTLPDSGARTSFDTGAVRDASEGKGLPSEIPPCALRRIASRFAEGAVKYERGNWRKGIPITRYLDAIARHSWASAEGRTDEDHEGAIAWNAVAMIWTLEEIEAGRLPKSLDDRPFVVASR